MYFTTSWAELEALMEWSNGRAILSFTWQDTRDVAVLYYKIILCSCAMTYSTPTHIRFFRKQMQAFRTSAKYSCLIW